MVMDTNETIAYLDLMKSLTNIINPSDVNISKLFDYVEPIYNKEVEDSYSAPMVMIGAYIAIASLWCVLSMLADLVHGLRSNKYWIPCKWFAVNAFSLTVIAVAMKLPVDLSGSMPGAVDQVSKLGSMAFMCTMMANLLPSLANMDSKALLANVTALGVLVITLVVNICIQIATGVIVKKGKEINQPIKQLSARGNGPEELHDVASKVVETLTNMKKDEIQIIGSMSYTGIAKVYVILLLFLLIIYVSSSLAILESKKIIERKYQQVHLAASEDGDQQSITVEKLQKHVSKYWIMAGSGSPQFISACSATTTVAGVISVYIAISNFFTILYIIRDIGSVSFGSDYKSSTVVIFIVQSVGVILGTVAPVLRCAVPIRNVRSVNNRVDLIFKVKKYWTQWLYDVKDGCISLRLRSHKLKVVIKNVKNLILNLCIILQSGAVLVCNTVAGSVAAYMLILLYLEKAFKCLARKKGTDQNIAQREYVLQLETDEALANKTLKHLLKTFNQLIQKSEKKQPNNLMKLITEKTTHGFQGVRKYDNNDHQDCWSLPVVTLTTIAITLPKINRKEVKNLLKSVREGLEYITLVEENLNAADDYLTIQKKAAVKLWEEVDLRHKWLGIQLKNITSQAKSTTSQVETTTLQVVKLFLEKSKNKTNQVAESTDDKSNFESVCANSMSRVTETIIGEKESHEKLFDELSSRIADIMAACLTNLPQAILLKCNTNLIDKREESVEAAAKCLGETKQMINILQGPLLDKWRAHLSEP